MLNTIYRMIGSCIVALVAAACCSTAAQAAPIVVGHRGAATLTVPEETSSAYVYADRYGADVLEGDVRWTRDGVMILMHDATLDRTTNCTGEVARHTWWNYIRYCRTDIGGKPVRTVARQVSWAKTYGKSLSLEIKPATITDAQARLFWSVVRGAKVRLTSFPASMASLNKVKALDAADPGYAIRYSLIVSGTYPSAAAVKAVGPWVELSKAAPLSVVRGYQAAGLRVCMWTGRTAADYALILSKGPDCIVVDDARAYRDWLAAR